MYRIPKGSPKGGRRQSSRITLPLGAVYILFTQNNVVLAYGESDGVGHEAWRVTFEKGITLGTLAIADVYGSLEPQVVVNTSTGHVVGLGR